jgi:hypothetical protein
MLSLKIDWGPTTFQKRKNFKKAKIVFFIFFLTLRGRKIEIIPNESP